MKNGKKINFFNTARRIHPKITEEKPGNQNSRRKGVPDLIKYLAENVINEIKNKQRIKQKEEFTKKRLEILFNFIFHVFSNIMNIISVLTYMIQTFFPEDNHPENEPINLGLSYIDLTLTFYFLLEYILLAFNHKVGYFRQILTIDSLIDMITIFPSIIAYFISFKGVKLSFIRIFRIFRVFRVLRIYKSLRRIQNETAEENSENGQQRKSLKFDPIKLQFFTIVVILVCVFFIGAGLVLGINDLIDNAFSLKNFNFLDAIYFMIVTFSTLGYGDITPTNVTSRLMIILGLFCLIIIVSDQMSKLANLLKFWGPGVSAFHGKEHIIIIADKTINVEMLIKFIANRKLPVKKDFIIISKDITPYNYTFYPYNKTQVINTPNIDLELLDLINSKAADGIFIFSSKYLNNYEQYDKITDFFLMKLTQNFSLSNIFIQSLNTEKTLLNVVLNDNNSNYNKKKQATILPKKLRKVVPIWKMKSLMIAKSTFNPGFSTFIQNLLYNYNQKPEEILEYSEIMQHYIHGTENKLFVYKLPDYFKGKDFYDVMYMIYFKSISQHFYKINTEANSIPVYLLVGVYESNLIDDVTEDDIEIFPNNYEIKNGTFGVFIGPLNQKIPKKKYEKFEELMNEFNIIESEYESSHDKSESNNGDCQSKDKTLFSKKSCSTSNLNNEFSVYSVESAKIMENNFNNKNSCKSSKMTFIEEVEEESKYNSKNDINAYKISKTKGRVKSSNRVCDSSNDSVTSHRSKLKSASAFSHSNSNSNTNSNSNSGLGLASASASASYSNSNSDSDKKSNRNVMSNINRKVSHRTFLASRMNSLTTINFDYNLSKKLSNKKNKKDKKEKKKNEFLSKNSNKNGNFNINRINNNTDKIFDKNTNNLNQNNENNERINKTFKRSSSSIDKTRQSESFKQSNNSNPILKKYKSSTIDTKNIQIKNLFSNNNDKINLEMKINICNQDTYFNNGNLNINLNLNTFVNNNNCAATSIIPENFHQEIRDKNAQICMGDTERVNNTISINNISNSKDDALKTDSIKLNESGYYKKKSDLFMNNNINNINNTDKSINNVFSSDSLDSSHEKNDKNMNNNIRKSIVINENNKANILINNNKQAQ